MNHALFHDRREAGRHLAEALSDLDLERPVVLAIPRGGIEVGAEIADRLGGELDVVLSRKIRAPMQPELAIGAIGEDGRVQLDAAAAALCGADAPYLEREQAHQLEEIERRRRLFREARPPASVSGRSAIVVDDGIATGATMLAALQTVRSQHPRELIVAVPVAAPDRLEPIEEVADRVICLHEPLDFRAVGQFYERFDAVADATVLSLLRTAAGDGPARVR